MYMFAFIMSWGTFYLEGTDDTFDIVEDTLVDMGIEQVLSAEVDGSDGAVIYTDPWELLTVMVDSM